MEKEYPSFHPKNFYSLCNKLGRKDKELKKILDDHGYPPLWTRPPSFPTLIHIILEQQVSLASAKAALVKLKKRLGRITPKKLLLLTDAEMRSCYFSRQKTGYARELARAIISKQLDLRKLPALPDDTVRQELKKIKGIGDWTVDIYLLFVLHRCDLFPTGDLAMVKAMKQIKKLPTHASKERLLKLAENWRPHRSVATMLLWHHYLETRKKF